MDGLDALFDRASPSAWTRLSSSPALYLAQTVYQRTTHIRSAQLDEPSPIRVVCISDTHNTHHSQPRLPAGDILIHAGDLTQSGSAAEVADALAWLSSQPHAHKLVIAGNHDAALADSATRTQLFQEHPTLVYLQDTSTTLTVRCRTLRVYGSPHTPKHGSWAFQYPRARSAGVANLTASNIWAAIPTLTDILITHGPPLAHLDVDGAGCAELLAALWRVRPCLHVFGHIHVARGVERVTWGRAQRAYEEVCVATGAVRWGALVRLMLWAAVERVGSWWKPASTAEGTILVNAAAVGGLKDEKRMGAVIIDI
ncbi:metallophosphoesterase domain-containing protein 1 [Mycena galericulata]|nr:metallophosphoesterase domain-containing protein 1 [Mycena galericulata]KAJ7510976.1 metallophosphoesterase domain-containing protein 1 [Mycena galericulata]